MQLLKERWDGLAFNRSFFWIIWPTSVITSGAQHTLLLVRMFSIAV